MNDKYNQRKISVVMCTYNGEKYIREQIDSILHQTYPIAEFIIQDDCSIDNTIKIIKEYAQKYSFIKIFLNEKQLGFNSNFFSALSKANSEYIAISDQDDIWDKEKLSEQMRLIEDSLLCFCLNQPFSNDGSIIVPVDSRMPNFGIERAIYGNASDGHTMVIRKKLLELIPPQKNDLYRAYDHILFMIAAAYNKVSFCNKILVKHRRFKDAATYGYLDINNYKHSISNYFISFFRYIKIYVSKKSIMEKHFTLLYSFLSSIPPNERLNRALKMCQYQSNRSIISYIKLTVLCIRSKEEILKYKEKKKILSLLRAITFPIYCSEYYKHRDI